MVPVVIFLLSQINIVQECRRKYLLRDWRQTKDVRSDQRMVNQAISDWDEWVESVSPTRKDKWVAPAADRSKYRPWHHGRRGPLLLERMKSYTHFLKLHSTLKSQWYEELSLRDHCNTLQMQMLDQQAWPVESLRRVDKRKRTISTIRSNPATKSCSKAWGALEIM